MGIDIAVDVGTSRTRIFIPSKGIVVDQPSVVTVDKLTEQSIAFGEEAEKMLGKTSNRFSVIYPLMWGVVSNYDRVQEMLIHFFKKVSPGKLTMPKLVACIPSQITEVEKRAIVNALSATGVRNVYLIEDPVAAAIGFGIDTNSAQGFFVIDIGGGTSDMAVVTLSGIASSRSLKVAGNTFDEEIIKYLKNQYNLLIGKSTAEKTKIQIGTVIGHSSPTDMLVKGSDYLTGMPKGIRITSEELKPVLAEQAYKIVKNIKEVLEETDPELISDIFYDGIHLSGGSASLHGLKELIEEKTNLHVHLAEDVSHNIILGTGKSLQYMRQKTKKKQGIISPLMEEY